MITLVEIQERLSKELKLCGLTQKQIADKIGVSQQTISHYIKGDKMPSLDTLANLCVALDLDSAEVLGIKK